MYELGEYTYSFMSRTDEFESQPIEAEDKCDEEHILSMVMSIALYFLFDAAFFIETQSLVDQNGVDPYVPWDLTVECNEWPEPIREVF